MAKIPQYESRVPMTKEVPADLVSPGQAGIVGEAMAQAGQQMTKLSEAIYKIRSDQQEAQAVLEGKKRMGEAVLNATSNPNIIFDENVANKELMKAREEALKLAPTPEAKANASARLDMDIVDYQLKLKTFSYKKLTEQRQITLGDFKTKSIDSWAAETNPGLKQKILDELGHEFQKAYDTGVISQNDFSKNMEMIRAELPEKQAEWDIYNDVSTQEQDSPILAELKKGNQGKYKDLSSDQRLDLLKKSQQRIFQNNQTFKRNVEVSQNTRNNDFIDKLASGTATFKDIDAEFAIPESEGGMKRSVLDQYQRRLQVGVKNDLNIMLKEKNADKDLTERAKKVKEYNDLIDMFIDDTGDQWKAKEALAKGYADGNLDAGEMKILNPIKDNLKAIEFNRNTSPIASAIKEVKKWMKNSNATDEELAFRTKQLINGIGGGGKPQEEVKKIMDSEMLKHFPDYPSYPEKGKLKKDSNGIMFRVFPDGSWAVETGKKIESK